ncbi:carbohydrate ABC transporter permease [Paenibacillus piri]|nr:carbohydrate ABC transporter permease [Paenibacillus piri]
MNRNAVISMKSARLLGMLLVLAGSVISLIPLYWTILNSFQPNEIAMKVPPELIPGSFIFDNYTYLFTKTGAFRWFINSACISAVSAALVVYFSAMAGYPLAKKKFPGVNVLFWTVLAFMTVPREVLLLPLFLMMKELHLFNTYLGILLPTIAWPFAVFLMRQFISTVPSEIFDAAAIDGCSPLAMFHKILLPIIKPGLGALAVFAFVNSWNDYIWHLIIISSDNMKTLPLGVASMSQELTANYGYLMAGASFGAIPLITVFLLFQRFFTSGITLGAVKG